MKLSAKVMTMTLLGAASVIAFDDREQRPSNVRGGQRHRALSLDPKTIEMKWPEGQQNPLPLLSTSPEAETPQGEGDEARQEVVVAGISVTSDAAEDDAVAQPSVASEQKKKSRRKFVAYVPSPWESVWKEGIASIERDEAICQALLGDDYHQRERLTKYMRIICSTRYDAPHEKWCVLRNDPRHVIYYNLDSNGGNLSDHVYVDQIPAELEGVEPPREDMPIQLQEGDERVFSKFIFSDEVTGEMYEEFIEPLVAHLRFPLAGCVAKEGDDSALEALANYQGYIMPPTPSLQQHLNGRMLYFEYAGGVYKKLQYQVENWNPDRIWVYPTALRPSALSKSMPQAILDKTTRLQGVEVVTEPTEEEGRQFIPDFINQQANEDDYVLWKLDSGSPAMKSAYIDALLNGNNKNNNNNEHKYHVDEIIWRQNLERDYVFKDMVANANDNHNNSSGAKTKATSDDSFHETYEKLSRLRQKGIRAHFYA